MSLSKKAIRTQYTHGAAHAVVEALKQHELQCLFVGEMACYLNGISKIPLDKVELVVFPAPASPRKQSPNVADLLYEHDSHHFVRKGKKGIAYYDRSGTIPEGKKDWCDLSIAILPHAPAHYQEPHIDHVGGLPTLTLVALIFNHIYAMLQRQKQFIRSQKPWPDQKDTRKLDQLLAFSEATLWRPLDAAFNKSAAVEFEKLSAVLPHYEGRLKLLILVCQRHSNAVNTEIHTPNPESESSSTSLSAAQPDPSNVTVPNRSSQTAENTTSKSPPQAGPSTVAVPTQGARNRSEKSAPDQTSVTGQSARKMAGPTPTQVLCDVAKQVVHILKDINCALFGSLGTSLYGTLRSPHDIDLLAFTATDPDPERLKRLIAEADPDKFYLRDSINPEATYKILHYRLTRRQNPTRFFQGNSCKIDILVPGTMNLPSLPKSRINWIDSLPVLPFSVLLAQKLQAWDDHRNMEDQPRYYAKRLVDKNDLGRMFKMEGHVAPLRKARPWKDRVLFTEEFERLCRSRAKEFCQNFPEFKGRFSSIGLLEGGSI